MPNYFARGIAVAQHGQFYGRAAFSDDPARNTGTSLQGAISNEIARHNRAASDRAAQADNVPHAPDQAALAGFVASQGALPPVGTSSPLVQRIQTAGIRKQLTEASSTGSMVTRSSMGVPEAYRLVELVRSNGVVSQRERQDIETLLNSPEIHIGAGPRGILEEALQTPGPVPVVGDPVHADISGSARWLKIVHVGPRGGSSPEEQRLLRLQLDGVPENTRQLQVEVEGEWKNLPFQWGIPLAGDPSLHFDIDEMARLGVQVRSDMKVRAVLDDGTPTTAAEIPADRGGRGMQWGSGTVAFNM